jgi:anti-anti-sigma regulatory factor
VLKRSEHECVIATGRVYGTGEDHDFAVSRAEAQIRYRLCSDETSSPPLLTVDDAKRALQAAAKSAREDAPDIQLSAVCGLVRAGDSTELDLAWIGPAPILIEAGGTSREIKVGDTPILLEPGHEIAVCTQELELTPLLRTVGTREGIVARIARAISQTPGDDERDMAVTWLRTRRRFENPLVIALREYLDALSAPSLKSQLEAALAGERTNVLLDMSAVLNVDPSALDFLPDMVRSAQDAGGDIRVVAVGRIAQIFEHVDELAVVPVYSSRAAAKSGQPALSDLVPATET